NDHLRDALDRVADGTFSPREPDLFRPIVDSLLNKDPFTALADYQAYVDCQDEVAQAFRDTDHWTEMSILNVARIGKFSSDRAIREYCRDIWNIPVREAPKPPAKNSGRKATQSRSTGSRS